MKNLIKILVSIWLTTMVIMWNAGPAETQRVSTIKVVDKIDENQAMKQSKPGFDTEMFYKLNKGELFVRKRKEYYTQERSFIPFIYKDGIKNLKVVEAIYVR